MTKRTITLLIVIGTIITNNNLTIADDPNLVGWYKLDENTGSVVKDSSMYGNNGKLIGAVWDPNGGKLGGAVKFDGSKNYRIEIPTAKMRTTSGTIALWANLADTKPAKRYFVGHSSNSEELSDRIQLFMRRNNTELNVGLGDKHYTRINIVTLNLNTWYHIVLTWDGLDYAVYIDGIKKDTGTYAELNNFGPILHLGNDGLDNAYEAFNGLLDNVHIFDYALTADEVALLYNIDLFPKLELSNSIVQEAKTLINQVQTQEKIVFLNKKIAELQQQNSSVPDNVRFYYQLLLSDLNFMLIKAKETAGASTQEMIASYEQLVQQPLWQSTYVSALSWLYEHISANDYIDVVVKGIHNKNITSSNICYISKFFESSKNWPAFKGFLDGVVSEVNSVTPYAEAVDNALTRNKGWVEKFQNYCKNNLKLAEYIYDKLAQQNINNGRFREAIELYRDFLRRHPTNQNRMVCEFKVCECLFNSGQYDKTILEIDNFIKLNKTADQSLLIKVLFLKGQTYIHLGNTNQAIAIFSSISTDYPESEQVVEAIYLIGYCRMLEGKYEEAVKVFNTLSQNYPKSPFAEKALAHLARVKNMAEQENTVK